MAASGGEGRACGAAARRAGSRSRRWWPPRTGVMVLSCGAACAAPVATAGSPRRSRSTWCADASDVTTRTACTASQHWSTASRRSPARLPLPHGATAAGRRRSPRQGLPRQPGRPPRQRGRDAGSRLPSAARGPHEREGRALRNQYALAGAHGVVGISDGAEAQAAGTCDEAGASEESSDHELSPAAAGMKGNLGPPTGKTHC